VPPLAADARPDQGPPLEATRTTHAATEPFARAGAANHRGHTGGGRSDAGFTNAADPAPQALTCRMFGAPAARATPLNYPNPENDNGSRTSRSNLGTLQA
jgi:hypothetical protein